MSERGQKVRKVAEEKTGEGGQPRFLLGYWAIRGLAQPIRLLLEYAGLSYEEKRYECGPAPDYDRSSWLNEKDKLGLDLPNLPYLIDREKGIKMTQSMAILRYLARIARLVPTDEAQLVRCEMMEGEIADFATPYSRLCYGPDYEKHKESFLKELPSRLSKLESFLEAGKGRWMAGAQLSYVDFRVADLLEQHSVLAPGCLDSFLRLRQYVNDAMALPKIAAYRKSPRFIDRPFNNPSAGFK